jgi:hypothetical protein
VRYYPDQADELATYPHPDPLPHAGEGARRALRSVCGTTECCLAATTDKADSLRHRLRMLRAENVSHGGGFGLAGMRRVDYDVPSSFALFLTVNIILRADAASARRIGLAESSDKCEPPIANPHNAIHHHWLCWCPLSACRSPVFTGAGRKPAQDIVRLPIERSASSCVEGGKTHSDLRSRRGLRCSRSAGGRRGMPGSSLDSWTLVCHGSVIYLCYQSPGRPAAA